jgi:hypothetical protein
MSALGPDDRPTPPADERTEERADELLPEELAAGSDDPRSQAAAILADSDARAAGTDEGADALSVEHRTSDETVEP